MESSRRKQLEEYQARLEVFESIIDMLYECVLCSRYGRNQYDCSDSDLKDMKWSEKEDHKLYDEEGLPCPRPDYDDEEDNVEWIAMRNERYSRAYDAVNVCRKALEKWLEK